VGLANVVRDRVFQVVVSMDCSVTVFAGASGVAGVEVGVRVRVKATGA